MKHSIYLLTIALLILSMGINPEVTFAQPGASIHQAAVDGNVARVKKLLDEGADINEKNRMLQYTPLHGAARNGRTEVVKLLVERGADINAKEKSGMTPLILAAKYNHKEVVELLIAKGADINVISRGNENAYSTAKKAGNIEIADLLAKKGATEPQVQDPYGDEYYGAEGLAPPGPGGTPRAVVTTNITQPQVDLLADPNEIMTRIKTFNGLEKIILDLGKKSATETRHWGQNRYDNRTTLARYVEKQIVDELDAIKKIAVEEKANKTIKAIDTLSENTKDLYGKVGKELLQQRREASVSQSSRSGRGRARGSSRYSGRGYSSGASSGGYGGVGDTGGAYGTYGENGDMGMSGRGRYGRTSAKPDEPVDQRTQQEISQWLQATTPDNKLALAKAIHPLTYADYAYIRSIAVEEKAEKTTAAIDGILLARQVRFDVYVKTVEALKQAATATQDPRLTGRQGDQNALRTRGGRTRGRTGRTGGRRRR